MSYLAVRRKYLVQPSVLKQWFNTGLFAAEVGVHIHGIVDTSGGKYVLTELAGYLFIEDIAGFLVGIVGIAIEYLGPDVTVIAGCVSATHGMVEIGSAITGGNLLQESALAQYIGFESYHIHIGRNLFEYMEIHAEIAGSPRKLFR
ncbi:hypothetical protein AXF24_12575 [Streptococcus pneumoniae]|nr:hypothetical protein AWW74_12590 [Streptococcus pneumoniae]KXB94703.1 hypothetical protein AXF24_12575 [Streptococcus pneumoniae]